MVEQVHNFALSIRFMLPCFVLSSSFGLNRTNVSRGNSLGSIFENKRDLQLDAVFSNLPFITQHDLLVLDPG